MSQTAGGPLLPPRALAATLATVAGAGILVNCTLLLALLTRSRNGLFCIITQLVVADLIILGATIWPELWSCNAGTWQFGSSYCIAYRGLSIFATTASMYLIITAALHTLATINLQDKETTRKTKKGADSEDEEIRSSRHSLVANSDSSTPPRTMNVDYRIADTRVSVSLPSVFVWILSASLSVPEFSLTSTINLGNDEVLCTLIDSSHRMNMYWMLSVFNFFLPIIIIFSAGVLVIIKLWTKRRLSADDNDSKASLKLCLWLIVLFCVSCAPRSVHNIYSTIMLSDHQIPHTDVSHHNKNCATAAMNLAFGSACLLGTSIRPLLCLTLLPRLRKVFSFRSHDTLVPK